MTEIDRIWSDHYTITLERDIWIAVMEAQQFELPDLIDQVQLETSRNARDIVNVDNIWEREMRTKHDLKARLDEFAWLSGHEKLHLGMTSADIVENSYLIRQKRSVEALGEDATEMCADLWLFRGIRGPVGSDQDQLDLLGNPEAVRVLNEYVAHRFGFERVIGAVAQTMPRSLDLAIATALFPLVRSGIDQSVYNGVLNILAQQQPWLEGDVSSSVIRRYAWPLLFKVLEGSLHEGCAHAQAE